MFKAAKQGVKVGEDAVSGLMFADDFVGIAETPRIAEANRKWRVTANVNKSTILVCNEDNNLVEFKWKRGEEELLIVDQHTYLGVEI